MTSLEPDPAVIRGFNHDHPLDERMFRDLMVRYVEDIRGVLLGTPPVPSVIDPDDAGSAGVSTLPARADHQHQFTSAVAAALTKTATAGEGSAATHARSDHVHSTAALPWGIVGYERLTTGSAAFSDGNTTDFNVNGVVTDATRLYWVYMHSQLIQSATGNWFHNVHADGTAIGRVHAYNTAGGANLNAMVSGGFLWLPTSDTWDVDVRLDNIAGGGTLVYEADAGAPRHLMIVDIGPR
jgi:hypothetical protein